MNETVKYREELVKTIFIETYFTRQFMYNFI